MRHASEQRALPSQAERGKRAAHPTRVGVVQHYKPRALAFAEGEVSEQCTLRE